MIERWWMFEGVVPCRQARLRLAAAAKPATEDALERRNHALGSCWIRTQPFGGAGVRRSAFLRCSDLTRTDPTARLGSAIVCGSVLTGAHCCGSKWNRILP